MKKPIAMLWFATFILFTDFAFAELIFSAPPRESKAKAMAMYGPLADGMSKVIGEKVTYKYPKNFLVYGNEMRAGKYDIVFDAGHFVSWRAAHIEHQVLGKLPGTLFFDFVTLSKDINSIKDLIAKKICTPAPPNLGAVTLLSYFKNPVRQPILVPVKGGFVGAANSMKKGKCAAAVLRHNVYKNKISAEDKKVFRVIHKSRPIPNQAITAGASVSVEAKKKLVTALSSDNQVDLAQNLLKRFAKKASHFEKTGGEEYTYLNLLLEGVVWGW